MRTFVLTVRISQEEAQPDTLRSLDAAMERMLAGRNVSGPRGGRYKLIGKPYDAHAVISSDPDSCTYTARVDGRYVKPRPT